MAVVYLHHEEAFEHTVKLDLLQSDAPITVADALDAFARSCSAACSGRRLQADEVQLQSSDGRVLLADWVLPCGEPPRADLFVVRRSALAAGPATGELTVAQQDAIRASQASKGEISYYYSVNKNLGNTIVPAEPRVPRAVYAPGHAVREQTIASFAMLDGDGRVKVNFPLAGAKRLPSNGICAGFFDRSFKLAIRPDASTELSLNVPLLCEPINQHGCVVKVLEGRVVVQLAKRQADRIWYELRKTKGVGDTEYDKLVPWEGELVTVTCGGSGDALPAEAAPVCLPGPPKRK
ncbi:hypothetical protein KFE25_001988 [Diacronema lutheri]|uniref:Uncharacterized protein n=2 Tax=Diacronema lutheri TaxID=2081491 RepID=A0A8J5XQ33_DIALT|nr:hypothetical protein KFE25_001988 [Diacronema lutheri]